MRSVATILAITAFPYLASASILVNQQPVPGGTGTWSQLWQDPSGQGNNLDGDSVCWEDFTLTAPAAISHLEWWGFGACELGFRIEFWRQDPNTTAYQPQGVWYYGYYGQGNPPVAPEPGSLNQATNFTTSPGPGGITHYVLDLQTPVHLAANDATNPRWFIAIIGLTAQAYHTWNWTQNISGSTHSYEFIRGGNNGGGDLFAMLRSGCSLVLADNTVLPGDLNCDGVVNFNDINPFVLALSNPAAYAQQFPNCNILAGDINGDGHVDFADINAFVALLSH